MFRSYVDEPTTLTSPFHSHRAATLINDAWRTRKKILPKTKQADSICKRVCLTPSDRHIPMLSQPSSLKRFRCPFWDSVLQSIILGAPLGYVTDHNIWFGGHFEGAGTRHD